LARIIHDRQFYGTVKMEWRLGRQHLVF
jgi:hypothetical protein